MSASCRIKPGYRVIFLPLQVFSTKITGRPDGLQRKTVDRYGSAGNVFEKMSDSDLSNHDLENVISVLWIW